MLASFCPEPLTAEPLSMPTSIHRGTAVFAACFDGSLAALFAAAFASALFVAASFAASFAAVDTVARLRVNSRFASMSFATYTSARRSASKSTTTTASPLPCGVAKPSDARPSTNVPSP